MVGSRTKTTKEPMKAQEFKENRSLPCILTNDEKIAYGQQVAREIQMHKQAEGEAKEAAASYKAKLEAHRSKINELSDKLASGREWRSIECVRYAHYDTGIYQLVRNDTGEVVESRAMTEKEKQMELSFEEAGEQVPLENDTVTVDPDGNLVLPEPKEGDVLSEGVMEDGTSSDVAKSR